MNNSNYQKAIEALKSAHLEDPNLDQSTNEKVPAEWLYTKRIVACLEQVYPDASEALLLAGYCQHLYRWEVKRSDYPDGRIGYYQWRNFLGEYQADKASTILEESGYSAAFISEVIAILKKLNVHRMEESQQLEDVVCLVFLEHYMEEFTSGKSDEHLVQIVQKTWNKMSENGHRVAMTLNLPERTRKIVEAALG